MAAAVVAVVFLAGQTITVISRGYVLFDAEIEPAARESDLYYQWSLSSGTPTSRSGSGSSYTEMAWDAPSAATSGMSLRLRVKPSSSGAVICERTATINSVRPQVERIRFRDGEGNNEYPIYNYNEADPEWDIEPASDVNRPVCYKKGTAMRVQADLAASDDPTDNALDLTVATPIRVFVTATYGGFTKTFQDGGYKTLAVNDWEPTDYTTLEFTNGDDHKLPNRVDEYQDLRLEWTYKVRSKSEDWVTAYTAGSEQSYSERTDHREVVAPNTYGLYLVHDVPKTPMVQPWKEVLDMACNWVDATTTDEASVMNPIRTGIWGSGIRYHGDNHYSGGASWKEFRLSAFLSAGWVGTTQVNCLDAAHLMAIHTRAVGLAANYVSKSGNLLNHDPGFMWTNYIDPIGATGPSRIRWGWHAFGQLGDNVWDAALQFDGDQNPYAAPGADWAPVNGMALSTYKEGLLVGAWAVSGGNPGGPNGAEPYDLANGDDLDITVDAGAESATFNQPPIGDIDAATAAEIASEINNDTGNLTASTVTYGGSTYVKIKSDIGLTSGRLRVTGGTAKGQLDFDGDLHHADGWMDVFSGASVVAP